MSETFWSSLPDKSLEKDLTDFWDSREIIPKIPGDVILEIKKLRKFQRLSEKRVMRKARLIRENRCKR